MKGGGRGVFEVEDATACVFWGHRFGDAQASGWGVEMKGRGGRGWGPCLWGLNRRCVFWSSRRNHAGPDKVKLTDVKFTDWV